MPNSSWNSVSVAARLAVTRPMPRSTLPSSTTMRVPKRSDRMPHKKAAAPMHRKSSVAAAEMPLRDQPVSAAIGCRKTASESMAPMPMQVISMPAPTTTQPYDSFMLHPTTMRTAQRGSSMFVHDVASSEPEVKRSYPPVQRSDRTLAQTS